MNTTKIIIDISTSEKKKEIFELFKSFNKIGDIYTFFNVKDTPYNNKYVHNIADNIGFDFSYYKEKKKKFCLVCGKVLEKSQKKFCSSSCAAKFNNTGRIHNEKTKKKISESLSKNNVSSEKMKICMNCGCSLEKQQTKYCSFECQHEYEYKEKVKDWKKTPNKYSSENIPTFIKKYLMKKHNCKCEKCGWGEINETTGNIPLQIHHKDGNCTNNSEENLELLCPNCHSLTSNYGSLNGLSRRYKLKKYKNLIK